MNKKWKFVAPLWLFLCSTALGQALSGPFTDDFSSYPGKNSCLADGSSFGPWTSAFSGYGCVKLVSEGAASWLEERPFPSPSPAETHASLVLGPSYAAPLSLSVQVRTAAQLRQGSAPNPWEVGWVLWDYADNGHFYYFQAKPNGWELGKEDPAYPGAQRFLATGPSPSFPVGGWYTVQIAQAGNTITVSVDGRPVTSFTDLERPYVSGRIGLYNEDADAQFTKIAVNATAAVPPSAAAAPTGSRIAAPAPAAPAKAPSPRPGRAR